MGGQHATYIRRGVKRMLVVRVMERSELTIFVGSLSTVCMLLFYWQQNTNLGSMCRQFTFLPFSG